MEPKEKEVALWWRRGVRGRAGLTTASGEPLLVLEPGRPAAAGPDFQGAVIHLRGQPQRGDVEVHRRASGWLAHRHHQDPRYNGVVLQAVLLADRPTVPRQDGREVQVVGLGGGETVPGCASGLRPEAVALALERWGEERFQLRALALGGGMAPDAPGQVLYRALMEALGYPANRQAFLRLAMRLPLQALEAETQAIEPLLLSAAPGLPWQGSGWRPANHPYRRLRGMARLLVRYRGEGLLRGMMGLVRRARSAGEVEAGLVVAEERPALIGQARAGEMAVNGLLPFAAAYGSEEQALSLFRCYPPLEENSLTRHMRELLGIGPGVGRSARAQQGLLHLYRTACSQGACPRCPLGLGPDAFSSGGTSLVKEVPPATPS